MTRTKLIAISGGRNFEPKGTLTTSQYALGVDHAFITAVPTPRITSTKTIATVIERYTREEDYVLDPFCGSGSISIISSLYGRRSFASDIDPLSVLLLQAKSQPVRLDEIIQVLEQVRWTAPVEIDEEIELLGDFFSVRTFSELINLKSELNRISNKFRFEPRIKNFIKFIVATILHGPTKLNLSTYTAAHMAVSPDLQRESNAKRRLRPEYREVAPRIVAAAGSLLVDGVTQRYLESSEQSIIKCTDSRKLAYVPEQSCKLALFGPPLNLEPNFSALNWLRCWLFGLPWRGGWNNPTVELNPDAWRILTATSILEIHHKLVVGGIMAVEMVRGNSSSIEYSEEFSKLAEKSGFGFEESLSIEDNFCPFPGFEKWEQRGRRLLVFRKRRQTAV